MRELELVRPEKLKIKIGGEEVFIKPPTYRVQKQIQARMKAGEDQVEIMDDVLVSLGFPRDVLDDLMPSEINKLVEFLFELDKKK